MQFELQDFFILCAMTSMNQINCDQKIIVAIDGFSACGKSTLAKDLARRLRYTHIDSGAMYRAVTLYFQMHQIDLNNATQIEHALDKIQLGFRLENGHNSMFMNGQNVEKNIRSMLVNKMVSAVAAIGNVRDKVVEQQRLIGADKGIVMDGRDIGTVVFPHAALKIFVTADIKVRTQRRWEELQNRGFDISKSEVSRNLEERDAFDSSRKISPLRKAEDAIEIDTSFLNRAEQSDIAYDLARSKIAELSNK